MDDKKKKLAQSLGDDSGEMDVIKDIFAADEPAGGTSDIFSSELFNVDPFAPAPAKAPEPAPAPALGARVTPPASPESKSPQGAQAFVPAPPAKQQIKVITNDDFEKLMQEQTSPGIPAPESKSPQGAQAFVPAQPEPPQAKPAPPKEETIEDVVLQAVAEDYHAVGAAKKGAALEQVAHELEGLEPMGDDFMSTEEMKKLFGNVKAITESLPRLLKRLDNIEEALAKLGALKK